MRDITTPTDPVMPGLTDLARGAVPDPDEVRGVLGYPAFRKLWIALSLSSLGDWLGLLATTALASNLAGDGTGKATFAIGGVLIFRLLPAVLLGPISGVFADRYDRRITMVSCDLVRFLLFVSIPVVTKYGNGIAYLLAASFLIESVSLFWIPPKEASVPNLLPRTKLEAANQLSLITTYGSAPVAAAVFAVLAKTADALGQAMPFFKANPVDLSLYFNAATFLFSAFTVFRLREIGGPRQSRQPATADGEQTKASFYSDLKDGMRFLLRTPLARGLILGILGAFAAGGAVIALGRPFVGLLGGGDAAYGVLFGLVFAGLAIGMGAGPRWLRHMTRQRTFGLSIMSAGISLVVESVMPNLVLALFATLAVGFFAGIAWITGYTLLGAEIDDELRGRTFAAVQSLVRVDLLVTLACAPFLSGLVSEVVDHWLGRTSVEVASLTIRLDGVTLTLLAGGLTAFAVGFFAFRQMDDGVRPLWRDLAALVPWLTRRRSHGHPGLLVALEGGEGAGKSTQQRLLADWLETQGLEVVTTFEPGATRSGAVIRSILLDRSNTGLSARAEALLYAADRAHHVDEVIRPALARGAIVITDRYVDSSLAYQGAGRELEHEEVRQLSEWATGGITPDLTVLLDVRPEVGLRRIRGTADRIEAESLEFHQRVRERFLELARADVSRHVIIDAAAAEPRVHAAVRVAVEERLAAGLEMLRVAAWRPVATGGP